MSDVIVPESEMTASTLVINKSRIDDSEGVTRVEVFITFLKPDDSSAVVKLPTVELSSAMLML